MLATSIRGTAGTCGTFTTLTRITAEQLNCANIHVLYVMLNSHLTQVYFKTVVERLKDIEQMIKSYTEQRNS